MSALAYDVFVSEALPLALADLLPNGGARTWAPLATTLIYGKRDAVLIDPPLTSGQAAAVGDRVEASGKRLTDIFVTHGHGDRWFTAGVLAERFANVRVLATPGTIDQMAVNQRMREGFWNRILPGQIPTTPVPVSPVTGGFALEGHELRVIEVGHSDTDATTVLYVPSLELVVTGDVVYDGVHLYLVESANGGRDAWRAALATVESLRPQRLSTGHIRPGLESDASRAIAETRRYLDDVDELLIELATPAEFFNAMIERYPEHANQSSLWGSALALYAAHQHP